MKYLVKIVVTEKKEYTAEVEATSFSKAEDAAVNLYFSDAVNPKITSLRYEAYSDQLTYECEGCAKEITGEQYNANRDGFCADCVELNKEPVNVNDIIEALPIERRQKIAERSREIMLSQEVK